MNLKTRLVAGIGTCLLVGGGVMLVGIPAASAHTTDIQGTAQCQPDGTYKITWVGETDQVPTKDIAKVTETSPTAGLVIIDGLAANASYSFVTNIGGNSTVEHVGVTVDWRPSIPGNGGDYFSASAAGSITLAGDCQQPPEQVPNAVEPAPTAPDCDTDGSVSIPANTDKVKWLADGNQVGGGAGGDLGPGTYVVTAHTTIGYLFENGTRESGPWTIVVAGKLGPDSETCAPPTSSSPPPSDTSTPPPSDTSTPPTDVSTPPTSDTSTPPLTSTPPATSTSPVAVVSTSVPPATTASTSSSSASSTAAVATGTDVDNTMPPSELASTGNTTQTQLVWAAFIIVLGGLMLAGSIIIGRGRGKRA